MEMLNLVAANPISVSTIPVPPIAETNTRGWLFSINKALQVLLLGYRFTQETVTTLKRLTILLFRPPIPEGRTRVT